MPAGVDRSAVEAACDSPERKNNDKTKQSNNLSNGRRGCRTFTSKIFKGYEVSKYQTI